MAPEHVAHVAGAGLVAEFLQLAADALVTPGVIFFGQAHNQSFGVCGFAGTSCPWRLILEGPFLLFLAPIPGQERFRLGDGNDVSQTSLNSQAVFHENAPVRFRQGHSGAEFASQDLVLLPQVIIFQSEVMAKKLVHLCDQRIGRIPRTAVHQRQHNASGGPGEFKTPTGIGDGERMNFCTLQVRRPEAIVMSQRVTCSWRQRQTSPAENYGGNIKRTFNRRGARAKARSSPPCSFYLASKILRLLRLVEAYLSCFANYRICPVLLAPRQKKINLSLGNACRRNFRDLPGGCRILPGARDSLRHPDPPHERRQQWKLPEPKSRPNGGCRSSLSPGERVGVRGNSVSRSFHHVRSSDFTPGCACPRAQQGLIRLESGRARGMLPEPLPIHVESRAAPVLSTAGYIFCVRAVKETGTWVAGSVLPLFVFRVAISK
jgi:hypothetical protein